MFTSLCNANDEIKNGHQRADTSVPLLFSVIWHYLVISIPKRRRKKRILGTTKPPRRDTDKRPGLCVREKLSVQSGYQDGTGLGTLINSEHAHWHKHAHRQNTWLDTFLSSRNEKEKKKRQVGYIFIHEGGRRQGSSSEQSERGAQSDTTDQLGVRRGARQYGLLRGDGADEQGKDRRLLSVLLASLYTLIAR